MRTSRTKRTGRGLRKLAGLVSCLRQGGIIIPILQIGQLRPSEVSCSVQVSMSSQTRAREGGSSAEMDSISPVG